MLETILVNSLIYWKGEDKTIRVLWIDNNSEFVYIINITTDMYNPEYMNIIDIILDLDKGIAKMIVDDPWSKVLLENDIKDSHKEKRDKAWEVITYIFNSCSQPEIYDTPTRNKYIKEASIKFTVSEKSIRRYLNRYWQRGKTKNALLPEYYNCGGKGKIKTVGEFKRGRPSKDYTEGINIDENIKSIFRLSLRKFYYTTNQNSLRTAYELMLKDYFVDAYRCEDGVKKPLIMNRDEMPSMGQFRYWFEQERNLQKEVSTRTSAKRYHLENRAVLGDSTKEALGPGGIYQIDATVADVYLLSRYNKSHIIGRPIVYAVIDVFSRMIVGLYIGLEGPSWAGAMMALSNSTMNKEKFCKEYDIDINHLEWPANYLPETIIADRGEFEGKNVETLIGGLNIKVSNTASYRGDMKAIVERYFRTINTKIKPFLPGFVGGDFAQRGGKDYRLDAKLDIFQFTRLIIKCILHHNNHHYLSNYNREEMMIEDDINPIPINLWNWGIQNRAGRLRYIEEDLVKLNLMPRDKATVTGRGISFKGILYGSEGALKEKWFEKARNKGSWRVVISYDPRVMDYIYIVNESGKDFEKCYLLNHEDRYARKTLEEIEYLLEFERMKKRANQDEQLQSNVDLMGDIEAIVSGAQKQAKEGKVTGESKRSKLSGISENRSREKTINRESEFLELNKQLEINEGNIIYINPKEEKFELDDINLIRKKQKERLKND